MLPDLFTYNQVLNNNNTSSYFSTLKQIEIILNGDIYLHVETDETLHLNVKNNMVDNQIILFTDKNKNAFERYKKLAQFKDLYGLNYIPSIEIKENEFKFNDKASPVVILNTAETLTLNEYIGNISFLPELVVKLQNDVKKLFNELEAKQIAHGNLTFHTIKANCKGELLLTNLDHIYLPEFESLRIQKYDFVTTKKRDLIAKGLILSAFEYVKLDPSTTSDNLIFKFNTKDLDNPQTSIAYTLLNNSGNDNAINYLNFETINENLNPTQQAEINQISTPTIPLNNSKVQKVIISSIPKGITVRDDEYDAIGITPYTLEIKEEDDPYQIILQEKDKLKKIDVYYGMEDIEIDINNLDKTNAPTESKSEALQSVLNEDNADYPGRKIFWGYVAGLFGLMVLITIINSNNFSFGERAEAFEDEVDSMAYFNDTVVVDSVPYYYEDNSYEDNSYSNDYYYGSVVDSIAVIADSTAVGSDSELVSPYYYE